MALIEEREIQGSESDDNDKDDEEHEIGNQATAVERLLGGGVKMRTDYIAGGLADEEDCSCSLLFSFAGCILRGPGVDQGGNAGIEGYLRRVLVR